LPPQARDYVLELERQVKKPILETRSSSR